MRPVALLLISCLLLGQRSYGSFRPSGEDNFVHVEETLGVAINDHARIASWNDWLLLPSRNRAPIVYFYSRGGRQIRNRGAEVFHQLHDEVRRQGVFSYLEDGVDEYRTEHSQYVEDYAEIFEQLGPHDVVVVTAIPHAMDEACCLLPGFTGAPHLANRTRVIKWQIGYSFPSLSYFVDELQPMICDTHFLKDAMGCVKEAVIRAPPLPMYYHAAAAAAAAPGGLAARKERLVLYDNDHVLDASRLKVEGGDFTLLRLDGMSREAMFDAYRRAVAVVDLWLPGAETVTAEGALFGCCVFVSDEMNGADDRDFPVDRRLKVWPPPNLSSLLLFHAPTPPPSPHARAHPQGLPDGDGNHTRLTHPITLCACARARAHGA